MKIVVVGIGGIGGVVGAKLAFDAEKNGQNQIVFFCRGKTLEAVRQNGLEYRSSTGTIIVRAQATDNASELGTADAVLFAVKNYSLEQAAEGIAPAVGADTVVIPLLNGVQAYDVLKEKFPNAKVLGGCIYISAFIVEPGVVEQTGNWMKIVCGTEASLCGGGEENPELQNALVSAGLEPVFTQNIEDEMWTKFISISSFAAATSVFKRNAGEIFSNDDSTGYFKGLLAEIVAVAKAKGINLPNDAEQAAFERMRGFPPETKTSMQRDFEKGGATELEALVGYVCREAARLGVKTPLYDEADKKLRAISSTTL